MITRRPRVAVVVVNWNGLRHLQRCLGSLAEQTLPDAQVILVDNGSSDGSMEFARERFPSVRIVENERNLGFAAAVNQGIRQTESELVATLNNDAWVEPSWLEELVGVVAAGARVGMGASKMLFADRPSVVNSAGICVDRLGIAWDRHGGMRDCGGEGIEEVFGPCAGAAIYRRDMLDEIGLFDEDFFAYLEDVDLAWRARWRGWRCLYAPAARAYHAHSATAGEGSPLKRYLLGRNKLWTILKDYPWPQLGLYLPLIGLYDGLSVVRSLTQPHGWHSLRGRLAAAKGMGRMLGRRRAIQGDRTASGEAIMGLLEPVQSPSRILARYAHLHETEWPRAK